MSTEVEELYQKSIELVNFLKDRQEELNITTLQRRFRIGFTTAKSIYEKLTQEGYITTIKNIKESHYHEIINDTDYCTLWKRVMIPMSTGGFAALELITVKEHNTKEIRLAYYKNKNDTKFVLRPLDLQPEEFSELITKATSEGILKIDLTIK